MPDSRPKKKKDTFIRNNLNERRTKRLLRALRTITPVQGIEVEIDGRRMLNFCSNDYLGLSKHPLLRQRAFEFMERYGSGSTASRLVCGTYECVDQVEKKIASFKGSETALVLNSGYQTNVTLIPALADKNTLILSDELNHNSIIQGSLLARCHVRQFGHNDLGHLKELLEAYRDNTTLSRILIVTESVFSMDGDQSDIDTLVDLAETSQALLIIDEAHATGVLGPNGKGLTCQKNVDLKMGTFGKGAGSFGAYVACDEDMRDYLINFCYGFIYTTALPPAVIGSIDAALELIPSMDQERQELLGKADQFRSAMHSLGLGTGKSTTQIVPIVIGDEKKTLDLSAWLEENGILATAFRAPTVEPGKARIRVSFTASHTQEHVDKLIDIITQWCESNDY
jgi:8-amino-7-oxononanoate synthase